MVDKVIRFTKDTRTEVEELKKSPMKMFRRVVKETEPRNADWLLAAMKGKMLEHDY